MDNKDKLEIVKDNENIESNNNINEVDKKTASASEMVENATYSSFEHDYACEITKRNLLLMDILAWAMVSVFVVIIIVTLNNVLTPRIQANKANKAKKDDLSSYYDSSYGEPLSLEEREANRKKNEELRKKLEEEEKAKNLENNDVENEEQEENDTEIDAERSKNTIDDETNDYFYDREFDKLTSMKVGEKYEIEVNYEDEVDGVTKTVEKTRGLISITDYYRFYGDDEFPAKEGYEWCYFSIELEKSREERVNIKEEISDCLDDMLCPYRPGRRDATDSFWEFDVEYNNKKYDSCLFKQSSKTDGMKYTSETWVRVPSGYTGIVFLYDCYDWYKYTFDHDNMEPRSVNDLITKETKYFRLGSGGDFITYNSDDSNLEEEGDELSGEYLPEANSDVYIRIKKINEDTWQYDTLFVADDTVVEGFPTRHYKYKEDNMWECVSEDYRGYFIQKLDENQIYNDEIYDCTIYTRK
ncbi:MAG: hypothetical protein SPF36_09635 [Lachnospiraceae bacterium]|nr:hypothetical protein [Lachnospiraceae bacterium]